MSFYHPTEKGLHDAWRDVNDTTPTALSGVGKAWPGMTWSWQGCLYQYIRNRSGGAITEGQATSLYFGAAGRIGNITANATKAVLETDDTFVANELVGPFEWPSYVFLTAGTTIGERRQIFENNAAAGASTITVVNQATRREAGPVNGALTSLVDAYGTLPDATTDYSVFCPWEVVLADIDALITSRVQGIGISTSISDGNYGVIQLTGPAIALVDGTTDLVAGDHLIADAAAGNLSKWVITDNAANTIAAEILRATFVAGYVLDAYTTNSAGRRHIVLNGRNAVYPTPTTW